MTTNARGVAWGREIAGGCEPCDAKSHAFLVARALLFRGPDMSLRSFLWIALGSLAVGCGPVDPDQGPTERGEGEEPIGTTSAALSSSDPVSAAVDQSCTTTSVKGLATQLVEEIQCMRPGTMDRIDTLKGANLQSAVFPYLQTKAAASLAQAIKARGVTMTINSALRTLPQQYLLYRWYKTGRCGIGLAASPGTSNHESGLALDIEDQSGWQSAMKGAGFRWLGASDPVHFDYVGGGTVDLGGLSVEAFQRLWNRNHPNDTIAVDGDYGPDTEKRLAQSPVGGFPIGAQCNNAPDAGAPPPKADAGSSAPPIAPSGDGPDAGSVAPHDTPSAAPAAGCSATPSGASPCGIGLALAFVMLAARRRAQRTQSSTGRDD